MNGTILSNAISDPKRRLAAAEIRPNEDRILLVEGRSDREFFKHYVNGNNIKVQKIREEKGKKGIIQMITKHNDYYGIVDMDYDFETLELMYEKEGIELQLSNISDTNPKCNLFSFALGEYSEGIYEKILNSRRLEYCFNDKKTLVAKDNVIRWLRQNQSVFNDYLRERTHAILFRGGNSIYTKSGINSNDINSIKGNEKEKWINDLIPDEKKNKFEEFKSIYIPELKNCGVNDHELIKGLKLIMENCGYPKRKNERRELENAMMELMLDEAEDEKICTILQKAGVRKY